MTDASDAMKIRLMLLAGVLLAAVAPVAGPASPPATAEERFGYEGELARKEQEKLRKEGQELEELHSKAAGISKHLNGTLVITLENGQVWGQNAPESYFPLEIGDPVRIRPAAMGSFLLYGNSKRSIRVTRLR